MNSVVGGAPIHVLIQEPRLLVRGCLRVVVQSLDGMKVIGEVRTPSEAFRMAMEKKPELVLLDLDDAEGALSVIRRIAAESPETRTICLGEEPDSSVIQEAFAAGAVGLALKSQPAEFLVETLTRARNGLKTIAADAAEAILEQYVEILQEKRKKEGAVVEALASAVEAKDATTGSHVQRVSDFAIRLARRVDPELAENDGLRYGFVLHDVGKIGIPEQILRKPGPLNDSEWSVMRTHPSLGLRIINPLGLGELVEEVVLHHHERWDGTGYPGGLIAEEIPLAARIFAIADAYDAMTSDRPYRKAMHSEDALDEIRRYAGSQFDPELCDLTAKAAVA